MLSLKRREIVFIDSLSKQGFFSSGFTTVALNGTEKMLLEKHRLII